MAEERPPRGARALLLALTLGREETTDELGVLSFVKRRAEP